jgi:hypothetical protein
MNAKTIVKQNAISTTLLIYDRISPGVSAVNERRQRFVEVKEKMGRTNVAGRCGI